MQNLLQIHLLGMPQIRMGDSHTKNFPAQKVKLLFCYLVLFRHVPHPRSVLGGLFWGDASEARARHSLNTAVWRLRQWLDPLQVRRSSFLLVEEEQIAFNPASPHWLDTAEFEQRITWAREMNLAAPDQAAASLNRAADLYRGDLMEGCYADWCLAERARLQQLFLKALVHLMVYHGARRDYAQAITFAQRLLQDEPLREDVQRELMKLFVLDDQPAEALLQYRRCEAALAQELGIEPMPETQELFHQLILKSAVPPTDRSITTVNMPRTVTPQSAAFLQKIDAALEQLEAAQEELAKGIEALHQIRNVT